MKWCVLSLVLFLCVISLVDAAPNSAVPTSTLVPNSPPALLGIIPNFTWAMGVNLTDAFNLFDYFFDGNGDNLSFYLSPSNVPNITILMNQTTGYVSFYPDSGFIGTHNVTFIASDGLLNTSSNLVFLNVGTDTQAPRWSNASRSVSDVEQNDLVSFFTTWTDDFALDYYIFSIQQNGAWSNSSPVFFSGTQNISDYTLVISAAPGSTVRWLVYASDTSGNLNATDIFEFHIPSIPPPSGGGSPGGGGGDGGGSGGSGGGGGSSGSSTRGALGIGTQVISIIRALLSQVGVDTREDYSLGVTPDIVSTELFQGDSRNFFLLVKNTGRSELNLSLEIFNVEDIASVSHAQFFLASNQEQEIALDVRIPRAYVPGQYFGFLRIFSENVSTNVPLVITVRPFDPFVDFNLSIPESSSLVNPGKNATVNVTINQQDYAKDFSAFLVLQVKDASGIIYNALEKEITIGPSYFSFESLQIPQDAHEGQYFIYGRVEYLGKSALDSASFSVGYRFKLESFIRYSGFLLVVLILSFIFVLFIISYSRNKRKERLLQLYLLLSQLKDKLQSNDLASAGEIYIRIKHIYHEPVPQELLRDKEFLKEELKRFGDSLKASNLAQRVLKDSEEQPDATPKPSGSSDSSSPKPSGSSVSSSPKPSSGSSAPSSPKPSSGPSDSSSSKPSGSSDSSSSSKPSSGPSVSSSPKPSSGPSVSSSSKPSSGPSDSSSPKPSSGSSASSAKKPLLTKDDLESKSGDGTSKQS